MSIMRHVRAALRGALALTFMIVGLWALLDLGRTTELSDALEPPGFLTRLAGALQLVGALGLLFDRTNVLAARLLAALCLVFVVLQTGFVSAESAITTMALFFAVAFYLLLEARADSSAS